MKCKDRPSTASPIELECVICGGRGCSSCRHGRIEIVVCPLVLIPKGIWETLRYARLYEKGLPPVAGGVLDQSKGFIEVCGFIFSEEQYWKKKLGIIG